MLNKFFLIVPIGLEEAALSELNEVTVELQRIFEDRALLKNVEVVMGGIEFEIDQSIGLCLNFLLKIPSRILLRWESLTAKDFPVLYKKLKAFNWNLPFFKGGIGELHIAASQSRLNNEKRIQKVLVEEVFKEKKIQFQQPECPDLYLRMHNDELTLSIDTSGEHLHMRGYRLQQGEAPIRENYAAFLWSYLVQNFSFSMLHNICIIDPMVGSGTLLFEALLNQQFIKTRTYVLQSYIKKNDYNALIQFYEKKEKSQLSGFGFDLNPEVLEKANHNLKGLQKKYKPFSVSFKQNDISQDIILQKEKIQTLAPELWTKKRLLISNPPYGERLGLKAGQTYMDLCKNSLKVFEPEMAVFVLPDKKDVRSVQELAGYKKMEQVAFLNNGIRVVVQKYQKINRG